MNTAWVHTDAIGLIKIVALFAVSIKLTSPCKNWKLSATGWSHGIFDAASDTVKVSIKYTRLPLVSE